MKPISFDELACMPLVQHYEEAFCKATGVAFKLVPPGEPKLRVNFGDSGNDFCSSVGSTPAGCNACLETQVRIQQNAARKLVTQQDHCFAGLTEIAVPVVIDGRHVATLMSGQVFRRKPTRRDFEIVVKILGGEPGKKWEEKVRRAFFATPIILADKFEAIIYMLTVFALHLSDDASRQSIACADREPNAVSCAKEFVRSHAVESITLEQVLHHVHVSRFHFCKIFKKATGITLTEYVARVRVGKAKTLLADPSLRITDIVFAAGFGSVPQFNNVFKRSVGMPPTAYRATLRKQPRIGSLRA